jgi:micrococcal nuclease
MYEYKATVINVVDGDTVDVDIDLGFGIELKDERVRIMGIDTPESRTLDRVEKLFGKLAGERVRELLTGDVILRTQINKSGEDMKGKFGRILGDFVVDGRMLTDILVEEGYAVKYHGQNKDEISSAHLSNRKKLLDEGKVTDLQIKDAKERTRQGK